MTKDEYKELLSIRDRQYIEDLLYEYKFGRTCESCKYFYIHKKNIGCCTNDESIGYHVNEVALYGEDGCNKWEAKE